MVAEIIKPEFGKTAQNRDRSFVRDIKDKSPIVAEMARYHAEIKSMHGWRSTTTHKPHRFLIFSYTEEYGLDPTARCSIQTSDHYIQGIQESDEEKFLAVLRLDEPFEAQWPRERAQDTLSDLISNPIDTRHKDTAEVVLSFQPLARD